MAGRLILPCGVLVASLWLADSRHFILRDRSGIQYGDARTHEIRRLRSVPGAMIGRSVGVTRDNRWITFTETASEGDIWLMSLD